MNVKQPISLDKEEMLKVKAGNQPETGDQLNTTDPNDISTTPGTFMVKDSSIT